MHKKKKIIIILSILAIIGVGLGGFFFSQNNKKAPENISISNTTEKITENDAQVISFFPIGSIDNLDQTVLISFSKPMVGLKTLDQQTPCPLTISPSVEGKCRWISTQTLEFTPDQWKPATQYTVSIQSKNIHYTGNFTTPLLKWNIGQDQTLSEGIRLLFNFPVKIEQLQQYLLVKNDTDTIPVNITQESTSPGIYILKPQNGVWKYLSNYSFSLTNPLDAQEGNLASKLESLNYTTPDSIINIETLKAVNSGTEKGFEYLYYYNGYGNESNEISSYSYENFYEIYNTKARNSGLLPNKDIVLDISFAEVITSLSPTIIRFAKDNTSVKYTLSYVPEMVWNEESRTSKEILTKKKIRLTLQDTLDNDSTYTLSYAPDTKTVISKREFKTAAKLKITRTLPISYSKICIYTNNPLNTDKALLTTIPSARIQSIGQDETVPEFLYTQEYSIKKADLEKFLKNNDLCPQPKQDEIAYIINTRLNPSSTYQLNFTPQDIYGNTAPTIEKSFTTEKIKDKDKFLYIGHKDKNTIPNDVPLVINVQSINTDTANIQVCTMDIQSYLNNKYFNIYNTDNNQQEESESTNDKNGCSQSANKNIEIKNKNRILSNTRIDLEKDILGESASNNIIRVSGKLITNDPTAKTRNFSSTFVISNISLMVENGINKNILLASDFNGKAVPGLVFQGYNRDENGSSFSQTAITAKYNDKKGVYELNKSAEVIVASKGAYRGMIETQTDMTENYDFGYIAGQDSSEKEFLYLYTERPIYKPGDTIYFKGLLRNFDFDGFKAAKSQDAKIVIINEEGNELTRIPITLDKNSNFNGSLVLPKEINLGSYAIKYVKADQSEIATNAIFWVEEYKKPVFKVEVDSGKNDIIAGEDIAISINPSYYFGGKITNTAGTYNIISQKYYFNAKEFSNFQFGEGNDYISCIYRNECNYMDRSINIKDANFVINKDGNYTLNHKTSQEDSEQIYSFTFEVKDPTTQRPVSKTVSKVIHATDGYVGLQVPYRNTKTQGIKVQAVTLDRNAKEIANTPISIKLVKQNRKAIKKQGIDGVFYNDYSLEEIQESSEKITTDNKGIAEKILKAKSDGEYKIIVSYVGKSGIPFVSSQIVYVSGDDPLLWRTENNSITKVVAEKTMVNVGENTQYTIQSPINTGTIFIAIEKDDGILDYFTMPLESYATKLSIAIKKEYYPNIYIKVFLIGSQKDNPLPIYKRGLAISKINTVDQNLDIKITTDKELYLPGEKPQIQISVTDSKGKAVSNANLSIGIVDQSLLALKGNPVKNPFAYFYDMKRYLGTMTFLSLQTLVEKLEIKDTSDGSKGGDGGSMKGGNSKKKRGVFKDTAYRNANITTDTKGKATIEADALPDNLTTRVIESLVNTPDTKVGVTTKTIQTALSLMINPNLPNMFSVDDKIVLHPVIFNKTDKEQSVNFSISGTYLSIKNPEQKIKVPSQSQVSLDFDAEVVGKNIPYDTQLATKIIMSAKTDNKTISDDVQLWIPIIQNASKETVTSVGNISGGIAKEALDIPSDLQGVLTLSYSKSLLGSLLEGINSSLLGSYNCLEQRFSTFMPHIYTKQLYLSANKGSEYNFQKILIKQRTDTFDGYQEISLDQYIKQQLISMEKFQNTDGGFVFRYDTIYPQKSSPRLTNYIVSSLASLRDLGYSIPKERTTQAIKYLKVQFYKDQKNCGNEKISKEGCDGFAHQAMETISAITDRNPEDKEALTMRELVAPLTKEYQDTTQMLNKALLLGKLSKNNESYKKEIADILTKVLNEQLVMEPKTAHIGKNTSSDNIIDTAHLLEASTYVPQLTNKYSSIYDALQRWIGEQKKDGSRGSTQDTVSVIKSLTRFISTNPIPKNQIDITTLIGKKQLSGATLNKDDPFTTKIIQTKLSEIDHTTDINIQSDTKTKSYYDLTMSYFLPAKDIQARYEGFVVKKDYYKYEDYMEIANKKSAERNEYIKGKIAYKSLKYPKEITTYLKKENNPKIGEVLVSNMTITTSEPREQVAIENFIPAGTELINPHLSTESKYTTQNKTDYIDEYSQVEQAPQQIIQTFECDKEEFRTEKYFCYKENLDPGTYTVTSLIRVTHAGTFAVKPTMVFEFYHPENFGRTIGTEISVAQ